MTSTIPRAPAPFARSRGVRYFDRMGTCPDSIKRLIDHFDRQRDQLRSPDYNEAHIRVQFINPMFEALRWDIDNRQSFAKEYRGVVYETLCEVIASP